MQKEFFVIFEAPGTGACLERALVLRSQGIPCETRVDDSNHCRLLVTEEYIDSAIVELQTYHQENANWRPRRPIQKFDYRNPWPGVLGFVVVMLLSTLAAGGNWGEQNWFHAGKVDAGLVLDGQWWRTITALTLHGDIAHLAGNLGFGLAFGYFAGQYLGSGIAWLGILLAGAIGNWMNSYLQAATHTSVGASTAIFAALGLVAAFAWKRKLYPQDRWAYRIGPVIGGIALLAFTGTGGERTDVGAHLTGFVSGFLIGTCFALWPYLMPKNNAIQLAAGGLAIGLVGLAWFMAF